MSNKSKVLLFVGLFMLTPLLLGLGVLVVIYLLFEAILNFINDRKKMNLKYKAYVKKNNIFNDKTGR